MIDWQVEWQMEWTPWVLLGFAVALLLLVALRRNARVRRERILAGERAATVELAELALGGAELGLWDWHLASDCRRIDVRVLAMLGLAGGASLDGPGEWRRLVHPDDWRGFDEALARHLREGSRPYEVEYRMLHRNGHWVWLRSCGKVVRRDANGKPLRLAGTHADISALKQAEAQNAHLDFYDGLTGLPNRRLLLDRLQHALSRCERGANYGAVLLVDLDKFISHNDSPLLDAGDRLREMAALRLRQATRECDTVARLGGDEFVIVLEALGITQAEALANAERVAAKVLASLSLGYRLEGHAVHSSPSIGVVPLGAGQPGIDELLRRAGLAMHGAKAAGRNAYRVFDAAMQTALDHGAALEADLRFALARGELRLFYQPLVDAGARLCGVEALLRWQHPLRGLVGPDQFIAQAEHSGLIVEIGAWVLDTACAQLVRWAADPHTAALSVAVNVSARQFRQPGFANEVLAALARSGANPSCLKLELTESMLLSEIDDAIAKITLLKAHGVGCSLDDFGTGYSSLSHLNLLPIDQLKIDLSFVRDMLRAPRAASIVSAIVTLARNMGLEVVAEGVETRAQADTLAALGCQVLQGYLYAPALPVAELAPMLAPGYRFAAPAPAVASEPPLLERPVAPV